MVLGFGAMRLQEFPIFRSWHYLTKLNAQSGAIPSELMTHDQIANDSYGLEGIYAILSCAPVVPIVPIP